MLSRRLAPWRGHLFDAGLAAAMVALSDPAGDKAGLASPVSPATLVLWWTFAVVIALGLLLRRTWPVPALTLAGSGALAHQILSEVNNRRLPFPVLIDLAVPIVLYTVASGRRSRWTALVALAAFAAAEASVSLANPWLPDARGDQAPVMRAGDDKSVGDQERLRWFAQQQTVELALVVLLVLALGYALGEAARSRHAHVRTLEQHAADLEREHQQRIAFAAAAERAKIGRDLHDVVAHSLSVMVAQAQAALAAQHRHPERATEAVREVIAVGRESLTEMRRLVAVFGSANEAQEPVGVAALPALLDRVRAAGVPVRYTRDGPPTDLPPGVDVSVYRIVQEALTNTLKHAGAGARAHVRLAAGPAHIDVEVQDDGTGPTGTSLPGNGLRGMADRVSLLGGTLTTGPHPAGGFLVRTRLPVPAAR